MRMCCCIGIYFQQSPDCFHIAFEALVAIEEVQEAVPFPPSNIFQNAVRNRSFLWSYPIISYHP